MHRIAPLSIGSRKLFTALCTVAIAVVAGIASQPVVAFDGQRTGFLLGLHGGLHLSDLDVDDDTFLDDGSSSGLALAFRIGGGVSDHFALYFLRDGQFDEDDALFGLTGVGGTYYFRSGGPSAYLIGGVGVGDVTYEDDDLDTAFGSAIMVGGGYAFSQGFHVDGSIMTLSATDDENFTADVDYDTVSLRVMAGYVWF